MRIGIEWIGPGLVDLISTDPHCRVSLDAVTIALHVELGTVWLFQEAGRLIELYLRFLLVRKCVGVLRDDGTVSGAVDIAEGDQDTAVELGKGHQRCLNESGTNGCEGLILAVALVDVHVVLTVKGGNAAVLADTEGDVNCVEGSDWDVRNDGFSGERGSSGRAGVRG